MDSISFIQVEELVRQDRLSSLVIPYQALIEGLFQGISACCLVR